MSLLGHIQNGVVVFDAPVSLPDGTAVQVQPIQSSSEGPTISRKSTLLERLGDVVGKVDDLPPDASLNVDHYLYGHEKKINTVFADTSFYVAVLSSKDEHHQQARAIAAKFSGRVVTTDFVLLEVGNFFCSGNGRSAFLTLVNNLDAANDVEIVPATRDVFRNGLSLYQRRPDQEWSMTDCISFVVMHERGTLDALTTDHHFEQAGFTVLLK